MVDNRQSDRYGCWGFIVNTSQANVQILVLGSKIEREYRDRYKMVTVSRDHMKLDPSQLRSWNWKTNLLCLLEKSNFPANLCPMPSNMKNDVLRDGDMVVIITSENAPIDRLKASLKSAVARQYYDMRMTGGENYPHDTKSRDRTAIDLFSGPLFQAEVIFAVTVVIAEPAPLVVVKREREPMEMPPDDDDCRVTKVSRVDDPVAEFDLTED